MVLTKIATVDLQTVDRCNKASLLKHVHKVIDEGNVPDYPNYTEADYSQIKAGMTLEEVEQILGEGRFKGSSQGSSNGSVSKKMNIYRWESPQQLVYITINFVDGRVVSKSSFGLD